MQKKVIYDQEIPNGNVFVASLKKEGMKTIIISLLMLAFAPAVLHAQQHDAKSKDSTNNTGGQFLNRSKIIPISQMDQRKIYHWRNGERSTPTGRQAKDSSAKFARVYGDSAVVVKPGTVKNNTY